MVQASSDAPAFAARRSRAAGHPQQQTAATGRAVHEPRSGSPWEVAEKCDPAARRAELWGLLRFAWTTSTLPRQRTCRHHLHGEFLEVRKRGERAHYSGYITCGLVWTCPLCGLKIAAERAADITAAITTHHLAGGQVALLTFTMRHTTAQRLLALLQGLGGAWRTATQSKAPRRLLAAYAVGWIKRLEITVGGNGWHPHLHVLVFLRPGVTGDQVAELAAAVGGSWESRLVKDGFGTLSADHGVTGRVLDLRSAHESVADYVAKAGALELANPGTKLARATGSRTPLQLLAELREFRRPRDRFLWSEYETATRRRQMIRWSDGLRELLIPELGDELSDEDAANSTDGHGRLLLLLDRLAACNLRLIEREASLLQWAEVYDDDDQARELVRRQLDAYGLVAGVLNPPDG